jgi:hypothetical protein
MSCCEDIPILGDIEEAVRDIGSAFDDAILQPIGDVVEDVVDGVGDFLGDVGDTISGIIEDPKKLAMVALSVLAPGAGTALGTAIGLTGTAATVVGQVAINTALNGGDVKSAIISAAIPVVGRELAGAAAASFVDAGMDAALAESAGRVVAGAGLSAAQGKDPLQALIDGGLSAGTAAITRDIPGFTELPVAAQRTINSVVAAELTGRDPSQALVNSAISAGIGALQNAVSAANRGDDFDYADQQDENRYTPPAPFEPEPFAPESPVYDMASIRGGDADYYADQQREDHYTPPAPVAPEPAPVYDFAEPEQEPTLEEILSPPPPPPEPAPEAPVYDFAEPEREPTIEDLIKELEPVQPPAEEPEDDIPEMVITAPRPEPEAPVYDYGEPEPEPEDDIPEIVITAPRPNPVYDISGEGEIYTNYFDENGNEFLPDGTPVYDYGEPEPEAPEEEPPVTPPVNPPVNPPVKPVTPVKPPVNPPAQPSRSGPDLAALLALLGGSGQSASGSGQSAPAPVQTAPADVQLMEEIFGTNLFSRDPGGISVADAAAGKRNFSDGGSIDELLKLLRG